MVLKTGGFKNRDEQDKILEDLSTLSDNGDCNGFRNSKMSTIDGSLPSTS